MNYVITLDVSSIKRLITFYQDYQANTKNTNVLFFAKTEFVSVTIYHSHKVMFQGQDALNEYNMWVKMLQLDVKVPPLKSKAKANDYFFPSIGSDEVGTGDYFGPVVVCAAYVQEKDVVFLQGLKINDSKVLTDEYIMKIGPMLKDKILYSMVALHNEKYNEMIEKGYNLNKLKAYLHNSAIRSLLAKINHKPQIIVDQFAEESLYYRYLNQEQDIIKGIIFTTKAESKYASVAVGSIIARYAFLQYFTLLQEKSGYELLKGASKKVDQQVANIIHEKGESYLRSFAKVHFVTTQKAKAILSDKDVN